MPSENLTTCRGAGKALEETTFESDSCSEEGKLCRGTEKTTSRASAEREVWSTPIPSFQLLPLVDARPFPEK